MNTMTERPRPTFQTFADAGALITNTIRFGYSADMIQEVTEELLASLAGMILTDDDRNAIRKLAFDADERAFQFDASLTALEDGCYEALYGLESLLDEESLTRLSYAFHSLADALFEAVS